VIGERYPGWTSFKMSRQWASYRRWRDCRGQNGSSGIATNSAIADWLPEASGLDSSTRSDGVCARISSMSPTRGASVPACSGCGRPR
jgi:hypothetical protein